MKTLDDAGLTGQDVDAVFAGNAMVHSSQVPGTYSQLSKWTGTQFKAGVHCGRVTVAEVGEIKTEIAYHGDVVNTASRIQNLCNVFEKPLLVSESLVERLPEKDRARVYFVAEAALRGKEASTKIYTI